MKERIMSKMFFLLNPKMPLPLSDVSAYLCLPIQNTRIKNIVEKKRIAEHIKNSMEHHIRG